MSSLLPLMQAYKPVFAGAAALGLLLLGLFVSHLRSPLRKYPGPFLARWTNLWRLHQVYTHKYLGTIRELHDKHGPVIRIGPNLLDLDYPELIKTIYGTDGKWHKTEFYHNLSAYVHGTLTYNIFSTTSQTEHARMKRPIAKFYSMSNVLSMEGHVDKVVQDFCGHLERRFMEGENKGKDLNFGEWIAFYTWDFISSATYSQRIGFMDKAYDIDDTMSISDRLIDYFATVGQMPFLDFLFDKNPIKRIAPPNLTRMLHTAMGNMISRSQDPEAEKKKDEDKDYLDQFLEAQRKMPDVIDDTFILNSLMVNMLAGADSTAITLRSVFNFLITTPRTLRQLEKVVLAAGFDPAGVVPYKAARALPYLDAVIRESMRMHPGVGMMLERYVPNTGLNLPDGSFVPPGVAVGLNPYVIGRNQHVWGFDAEEFRPERWLQDKNEDDATFQQRLRKMNGADLTFGNGSRICIGRNLALLEVYKIIPTILLRYRILPCDAPYDFRFVSTWFIRQTGLVCKLEKRAPLCEV